MIGRVNCRAELWKVSGNRSAKCIEKYLSPEDIFVTIVFGEWKNGKVIRKGIEAKMTRGEMVRYMAEREIRRPEQMKEFDRLGYRFREGLSEEHEYVFVGKET